MESRADHIFEKYLISFVNVKCLQVSVQKFSGHEVLSDYGRISVFAPLSIHPPSLVIAPGSQYVVRNQLYS